MSGKINYQPINIPKLDGLPKDAFALPITAQDAINDDKIVALSTSGQVIATADTEDELRAILAEKQIDGPVVITGGKSSC